MNRTKEIVARLPEDVLVDIDNVVKKSNKTLSLFITEACCFYLEKIKRDRMLEAMKTGYLEMAEINQVLAEVIWCDFAHFCQSEYENWRKT